MTLKFWKSKVTLLEDAPISADLLKKWREVARKIAEPHFVYGTVAKELIIAFGEFGEFAGSHGPIVPDPEVAEEALQKALQEAFQDENLLQLVASAVFLRLKVGIESLGLRDTVQHLSPKTREVVYQFAREIVGALLLSGLKSLSQRQELEVFQKVIQTDFGSTFLNHLWDRFYQAQGILRPGNQRKTLCVAMTFPERGIGYKGHLPWGHSMPTDFKRFLRLASGHWGIMSSKNFESEEVKKTRFPGTETIVVSTRPGYSASDCIVVPTLEEALQIAQADPEVVYAGGSVIFKLALEKDCVDRILLTHVMADLPVDTHFPEFDQGAFDVTEDSGILTDEANQYPYRFLTYERRR